MTAYPMDESGILPNFNDFRNKLVELLQSRSAVEDLTLLQGFLQLVHSKTQNWWNVYLDPKKQSATTPNLLDLIWKEIHYPIFKWFQQWKSHLLKTFEGKSSQERKYIEFRKMNSKFNKVFKIIHKFYYSNIELLFDRFDFKKVLSHSVMSELNITKVPENRLVLDDSAYFTIFCVMSLQRCLLYLGCCHRYKCINGRISKNVQVSDFSKSMRYFRIATLIVPSVGETYLQKGLVYVQTANYGHAVYEFMRSSLSRMPTDAGVPNLNSIVADPNSSLFIKFQETLKDLRLKERDNNKIINREVLEFYFLAWFASLYAPENWNDKTIVDIGHCRDLVLEKVSTRYIKNIELLFQNVLMTIGGFELLIKKVRTSNKSKKIPSSCIKYLESAFKFFSHILDTVVAKEWQNFGTWEYLAMVRVICVWLKNHPVVLKFGHRHLPFCKALAELVNAIVSNEKYKDKVLVDHKPKREYFFEEDIMVRDFSAIGHTLSDFNDMNLFQMEKLPERLVGAVDNKLSSEKEGLLKLSVIVSVAKKFLAHNGVGIKWEESVSLFQLGTNGLKVVSPETANSNRHRDQYSKSVDGKNVKKSKVKRSDKKSVSIDELEAKLIESRGQKSQGENATRVYSGCSVPAAPMSFNVTPSAHLYQDSTGAAPLTAELSDSPLAQNESRLADTNNNQDIPVEVTSNTEGLSTQPILLQPHPHPHPQQYIQLVQPQQVQGLPSTYSNACYPYPAKTQYPMAPQPVQFQNGLAPYMATPYTYFIPSQSSGVMFFNNGQVAPAKPPYNVAKGTNRGN
ncbi:Ebs1p Ecym_4152 [Eremothecium cymbalariae DBVPG|uniref:DNA/RNA-binding domain-containing protein n=1 Tax=Eremothecium cymbalariae (strain CBS 270.75 / DBVPG 7215 / KCTC 17166 / NRRL Y-17582) TaxID=931890 RepID=G8JT76_ERECY|nr:hypothetical protein Ecym_4152 [Eremothecium cymbalariae DBVPG\